MNYSFKNDFYPITYFLILYSFFKNIIQYFLKIYKILKQLIKYFE